MSHFIVSCVVMGRAGKEHRYYNEERMYWESDCSRATRFPAEDMHDVERMLERNGTYRKRECIQFHNVDA